MSKGKLLLLAVLVWGWFVVGVSVVNADTPMIGSSQVYQERDGKQCGALTGCAVAGQDVKIEVGNISHSNGTLVSPDAHVRVRLVSKNCLSTTWNPVQKIDNKINVTIPGNQLRTNCNYALEVVVPNHNGNPAGTYTGVYSPAVQATCSADQCEEDNLASLTHTLYDLCKQIKTGTPQHDACMACFTGAGIWTAVGCIPNDPADIIKMVVSVGLAVGGGIVLIMILVGSFMLSVSQGDPNKTKEAKDIITSAIIGLLFVIFSVTILQFIGVSILRIPGFGE